MASRLFFLDRAMEAPSRFIDATADISMVSRGAQASDAVARPYTLGRLVVTAQHVTTAPAEISKHRKHLLSLPYYGVFDLG